VSPKAAPVLISTKSTLATPAPPIAARQCSSTRAAIAAASSVPRIERARRRSSGSLRARRIGAARGSLTATTDPPDRFPAAVPHQSRSEGRLKGLVPFR
jgi:hypothetical protein